MPFEFEKLEPAGLVLVRPKVFRDDRGFFVESYKKSDFEKAGVSGEFVQDNHSKSVKGVLRGLHYQKDPFAQGKLVRCLSGRILDVAVDIGRDSPSFGKWAAVELDSDSAGMLYIPPGFAHGFLVLSETAEIMYKCTKEFSPAHDAGIRWDDPRLGIDWGIKAPILSAKDSALPYLKDTA